MKYAPTWKSLDSRPCPRWYDDAKFGIFIHWGVYSVPAWDIRGSYAEWYWNWIHFPEALTRKFHERTYGANFKYQDFAPLFKAELFEPEQWAELFKRSGAQYVALTSKHHDGFCLWPSEHSWSWNSSDIGPHRDLAGELTAAVRTRGLKMGFYYSLYEWYHPLYLKSPRRFAEEHMLPQLKDLVERYQPSLIFADGEWEHPSSVWKSREFLAWLFSNPACRDEVVVNDRWGGETRSRHGSYFTTEYGTFGDVSWNKRLALRHKWEENRGIGASYGYNRNEDIDDYRTATQLIHLLIDTVSMNGNLLLNVGPTADGRIPVIMQERLVQIGKWLKINGEAIYGTRPWKLAAEGDLIRYTTKGKTLYIFCLKWPGRELVLSAPKPKKNGLITLLGYNQPLRWHDADGELRIEVPPLTVDEVPCRHAYSE
jgi:alpha-L-fucosidase